MSPVRLYATAIGVSRRGGRGLGGGGAGGGEAATRQQESNVLAFFCHLVLNLNTLHAHSVKQSDPHNDQG